MAADDVGAAALADLRLKVERESAEGRALVANIPDNQVGTVLLDAELPCVSLVWRGYATDLQIRYVHEIMLLLIRNHRIAKVLADNARLPAMGEGVRQWIAADWMPRAAHAGLRVIGATVATSVFANQPLQHLVGLLDPKMPVRFFDHIDAARQWLRAQPV